MEVAYVGRTNNVYTEFPKHSHGYWEIMYNKYGTGIMEIDGQSYPFEPGDVAIIPPGLEHRKVADSTDGFEDFCLFIKSFRPIGSHPFRILKDDDRGTVRQLMDTAAFYNNIDNVYERAILNSLGDLLYQTLVLIYSSSQHQDPRIEGAIEKMRNNIANIDFELTETIEGSGYCTGYFRKIFKEYTGQSPVEYMQHLRVNYAKSQMNQFGNSRSIKDVAHSSGFNDALYFSRVFKKITGYSPREYMKEQFQSDVSQIAQGEP